MSETLKKQDDMPDFLDENGVFDLNKKLAYQLANHGSVMTEQEKDEKEWLEEEAFIKKWNRIHAKEAEWEMAAQEYLSIPVDLLHQYKDKVAKIERLKTRAEGLGVDYSHKGRYGCRITGGQMDDSLATIMAEVADLERVVDSLWGQYLKAVYETMEFLRIAPLTSKERRFALEWSCSFEPFERIADIGWYLDEENPWHLRHKMQRALGKWLLQSQKLYINTII